MGSPHLWPVDGWYSFQDDRHDKPLYCFWYDGEWNHGGEIYSSEPSGAIREALPAMLEGRHGDALRKLKPFTPPRVEKLQGSEEYHKGLGRWNCRSCGATSEVNIMQLMPKKCPTCRHDIPEADTIRTLNRRRLASTARRLDEAQGPSTGRAPAKRRPSSDAEGLVL